jgi:hypothetical protein
MHTIKSVGIMSFAKISALSYFIIGLLASPFFLLAGLLQPGTSTRPFGAAFGIVFAAAMPFIYAFMGLIVGAIGAFVYNLLAGWIGGIQIDLAPPAASSASATSAS